MNNALPIPTSIRAAISVVVSLTAGVGSLDWLAAWSAGPGIGNSDLSEAGAVGLVCFTLRVFISVFSGKNKRAGNPINEGRVTFG
jgi:hypothetical protein